MLRFLTSGESHGKGLIVILEGLPSGIRVRRNVIEEELRRRRSGYGRGERMKHDLDSFEIIGGVKGGRTIGSAVGLLIQNEHYSVRAILADSKERGAVIIPRPGHADLAGAMKFLTHDLSMVSERASARETAARVAAGALCKIFLMNFGISVVSHTLSVGNVVYASGKSAAMRRIESLAADSPIRCIDKKAAKLMIGEIQKAAERGDSVGAAFQVAAAGVPPGLGSYAQWDTRADAMMAAALISIPAVKAVEIGNGIFGASSIGSSFHDEIHYSKEQRRFVRRGNNAGGIEGGITNGEEIRISGFLKPVATVKKALHSVSLESKKEEKASVVRSDVCPVVAASVIGESMVSFVLARLMLEKFGGDSLRETKQNYRAYMRSLKLF